MDSQTASLQNVVRIPGSITGGKYQAGGTFIPAYTSPASSYRLSIGESNTACTRFSYRKK